MSKTLNMMKPGAFKTTVSTFPTLIISEEAHVDISLLVDKVTTEVGWYALVDWTEDNNLFISEIRIPAQRCHAATTELTTEGLFEVFNQLVAEDAAQGIPAHESRARKLRCWGHSHVHGPVNPSGQDDLQMKEFGEQGVEYMIRSIHNKSGACGFDIFYYRNKKVYMHFRDVEWRVATPEDKYKARSEELDAVVKAQVSGFAPTVHTGYAGSIYDSDYAPASQPHGSYNHGTHRPQGGQLSFTDT